MGFRVWMNRDAGRRLGQPYGVVGQHRDGVYV